MVAKNLADISYTNQVHSAAITVTMAAIRTITDFCRCGVVQRFA